MDDISSQSNSQAFFNTINQAVKNPLPLGGSTVFKLHQMQQGNPVSGAFHQNKISWRDVSSEVTTDEVLDPLAIAAAEGGEGCKPAIGTLEKKGYLGSERYILLPKDAQPGKEIHMFLYGYFSHWKKSLLFQVAINSICDCSAGRQSPNRSPGLPTE